MNAFRKLKNKIDMELHEFVARTNVYLTDEIYVKVQEEYMASDMDKDAFCDWWKENRQLAVTKHMAMEVYRGMGKVEEYREQYRRLADHRNTLQAQVSQRNLRIKELEAVLATLKAIANA